MIKLVSVVGARPQFVKLSALQHAVERFNADRPGAVIDHVSVNTGQHYDAEMSDVFFEELQLVAPERDLGVGSGSHVDQIARMLPGLEAAFTELRPDLVLVYGDTNSTIAGALTAAKMNVAQGHVEAGLRSFDRAMPEEVNRVVADHLAQLLFCPGEASAELLRAEGVTDGVHVVGDVMREVVERFLQGVDRSIVAAHGLQPQGFALATIHRAQNADDHDRLRACLEGLRMVHEAGLPVIFPVHPRTSASMAAAGLDPGPVLTVPPLPYRETLALMSEARVVLTDSGGIQKEALWLSVPCVTLRDETEWPETVAAGWNRLVGCDPALIAEAALAEAPQGPPPALYGEGDAGLRIAEAIAEWFHL